MTSSQITAQKTKIFGYGHPEDHIRSIPFDLVLTFLTVGLFNLRVQYKQIQTVNFLLNRKKYSFLMWLILTLITFGLYHIYHEWRKSTDISEAMNDPDSMEPVFSLLLTVTGFPWIADAVQQTRINSYFGDTRL